ncbi:MAG: polyprenyl synthetase family protein [Chloroflexota bacterium]|nr:polyprenyl synthetase family protein [Chloroflexota bacterium]MDE2883541.1 polyprenyl synthetase family protein [Chloroflexota bacterium]
MPVEPVIPDSLRAHQPLVEQALHASLNLPKDPTLPLYRMMRYQLGWVDSAGEERNADTYRLLGALCLEASASLGGDPEQCAPSAAAIELLGESAAVHEDMQTAAQLRAGQDAVWWVWGPAQAINAGDGLYALARLSILDAPGGDAGTRLPATLAELDTAALEYYQGQFHDLQLQERVDVTEQQYMRMARGKYGALIGGALALGAVAAGADGATTLAFREAGVMMGVASLIATEERLFWGEGEETGRALNKSKLYPVVAALQHGTLAQKRALGGYYFKRVMEPGDLAGIRDVLEEAGARERTRTAKDEAMRGSIVALEQTALTVLQLDSWGEIVSALTGEAWA